MKVKSLSGLTMYVHNIDRTSEFYTSLGFRIGEQHEGYLKVYVNWFWIQFVALTSETKPEFQKEAMAEPKGAGMYIHLSVDDVDETYNELVAAGLKPSSEPRDWPWGMREFAMRDPDGYKLVFFTKK